MSQIILGIETSCDDTALALYSAGEVLAHSRISQSSMCIKYGGVVPDVAARNHFFNLSVCLNDVLAKANIGMEKVDVIACTIGPGLIGSLIVASSFSKYLCKLTNKIFVPVHHIEAHLDVLSEEPPYLAVIISGGHSQILFCSSFSQCEEICVTRDDAFGELIDKVGRAMGLEVPSGVHIEQLALTNTEPILKKDIIIALPHTLAFSCSGLKTHFLHLVEKRQNAYIASLLQHTIACNLDVKIKMAMKLTSCSKVIVAGGVAANKYIRSQLQYCLFASIELCTDNGIMVAMSADKHLKNQSAHINDYSIAEFANMSLVNWCLSVVSTTN